MPNTRENQLVKTGSNVNGKSKEVILTGDRPTGKLHLGHYIGSLKNRVRLQELYERPYIMIADMQAMTDHFDDIAKVREHLLEVYYDYLAVGIDPEKNCIFLQSLVPALSEFTCIYLNYVTLARLKRNPTVKTEMKLKGYEDNVPAGFLVYPVSQASDITAFHGTLVPCGEDQLPMLEQCNEIVRHINYLVGRDVLTECKPLLSKVGRLKGTDGQAKMSKSLNNCIYLADEEDILYKKIMSMYTDPKHLRVEDPGQVEGNMVFSYLDAFDPDEEELRKWKEHYQRGGLGDVKVKKRLFEVLNTQLAPIRSKRRELTKNADILWAKILEHSQEAAAVAEKNLKELKQALGITFL